MKQISIAILLFIGWGCCKVACISGELGISYQNFTASETDSIAYIKYTPGTNFTAAIDTTWEYRPAASRQDTTRSYVYKTLQYNWDWKIYMFRLNKTYTLAAFETATQKCACSHNKIKVIRRFKLNGVVKEGNYAVLVK